MYYITLQCFITFSGTPKYHIILRMKHPSIERLTSAPRPGTKLGDTHIHFILLKMWFSFAASL
jgi:hypothetical protein